MCCRRYRSGFPWHKRGARLGNRTTRSTQIAMKFVVSAPLALALGTLSLASCGSSGHPGAVYFTLHNDSASAATIQGVEVKGAQSAMIHQTTTANGMSGMQTMPTLPTLAVPAKGELAFAPGGIHVMAMDLADTLAK